MVSTVEPHPGKKKIGKNTCIILGFIEWHRLGPIIKPIESMPHLRSIRERRGTCKICGMEICVTVYADDHRD